MLLPTKPPPSLFVQRKTFASTAQFFQYYKTYNVYVDLETRIHDEKKKNGPFTVRSPLPSIIKHFKSMEAHPTLIGIVVFFHIVINGALYLGKV